MLDADGQHDPREIQRVAGLVREGKADLVIGSRFLKKNRRNPRLPAGWAENTGSLHEYGREEQGHRLTVRIPGTFP